MVADFYYRLEKGHFVAAYRAWLINRTRFVPKRERLVRERETERCRGEIRLRILLWE